MQPELIASIYDSVLHPEQMDGVIATLVKQTGAVSGYLCTTEGGAAVNLESEINIDPEFKKSYGERYWRMNPFLKVAQNIQPGEIKGEPGITTTSEFKRSEFYNDWMRPQGWLQPGALGLRNDGGAITFLGFWHDPVQRSLRKQHCCLLREVTPHLRRALASRDTLRRRLSVAETLNHSIAAAGFAVLLVEANGTIAHANTAAEAILRGDGPLRQAGGRLVSQMPGRHDRLRDAIQKATSAHPALREGSIVMIARENGMRPMTVHVVPMRPTDAAANAGTGRPLASLFLLDPGQDVERRMRGFRATFGLTAAECRLMEKLIDGMTLVQAAQALSVREATVRTQLSRIFLRTEASRQSDLIRLFFQSTM
jgi:DNA-binding CsgD family transcriptional regulator